MIGIVAVKATKPMFPMTLATIPAAKAPAKYVIEVHRKLLRHICQTDLSAPKAVPVATNTELAMYWTTAMTESATTYSCREMACQMVVSTNESRNTQTVMKVAEAITAALKKFVRTL